MSFKTMPVLMYQKIQDAIEISNGNEFRQWVNVLSVLNDEPADTYKGMLVNDFKALIKQYDWILEEKMPDEWLKEFTCQGEKFIVTQTTDQWTTEQFISLHTFLKDPTQHTNNIHLILATLCVKHIGEVVSLAEFKRRATLFQDHLPITTAYPIYVFYAAVLAKLSTNTRFSSIIKKRAKAA